MEYKQLSPDIVIRSIDGVRVAVKDTGFQAWLAEENSPFPPDPPAAEELDNIKNTFASELAEELEEK